MSARRSLVESVQGLIERTYGMRAGLGRVDRFIIGDDGYRRFYAGVSQHREVRASAGTARTLVRETDDGLRACIYYPDALIRRLEERPPQHGLCEDNVDAFATLIEELDHLLLLCERAAQRRPVSLFELELHANVTKQLVLARFLAGSAPRLSDERRVWLRHQLFEKGSFSDHDPPVRQRYREAARWAVKFLDGIDRQPARRRLRSLRDFHAAGPSGKIEQIRKLTR